jgi:type I restriction enzyme R subunit
MTTTDTSEKGLESLIMRHMTGVDGLVVAPNTAAEVRAPYGGTGYIAGCARDYDRAHALDVPQLFSFLRGTQPEAFRKLALADANDASDINRRKFLARLSAEIGKRGVIDVLRKGVAHGPLHFDLFYGTASPGNARAAARHAQNRFSITRQLAYSSDAPRRALDLCLFINGLPIATFELKNSLTKQTVDDAVEQYRRDRNPRERLFEFGRCVVHFAVDESEVRMCTELRGRGSWFLPFNKGHHDGAGNPPNPHGLKTAYLWQEVLTPAGLTNILENYAQIVEEKDPRTGRKKRRQVWPRYHQLRLVRQALADVRAHGEGRRYLIQHSAGSGKSNSIAWLAHQLIGLQRDGDPADQANREVFDSVVVVTDRRLLDDQIQTTIRQFMQVGATVGHAERAGDLRRFIEQGRKIIVSTVQKFPFILDEIAIESGRTFAIIIDEAHSSQGGKTSAAMSQALGAPAEDDDAGPDPEDTVNAALEKRMAARKLLANASYFAFTATPKNKTLEMFGEPLPPDAAGRVRHRPFHSYTMKQAVEEGFILDVLKAYTPVDSYYRLVRKSEDDPEFDTRKANTKLRRYVESHAHAIRLKTEIMVDHFHAQVLAAGKIGGQARAMVVTSGIERAIQYFHAFQAYLRERKSPYQAIVAFSGEHEVGGAKVSEASLNGFASGDIARQIRIDPYRFLICADKFQTGTVRNVVYRRRPGREADPRRHRAQGRRRRGLPQRPREHPAHGAHGTRPGARQGDADPPQGRHAGLQAVRRERVVSPFRRRHGVRVHRPAALTLLRRHEANAADSFAAPCQVGSRAGAGATSGSRSAGAASAVTRRASTASSAVASARSGGVARRACASTRRLSTASRAVGLPSACGTSERNNCSRSGGNGHEPAAASVAAASRAARCGAKPGSGTATASPGWSGRSLPLSRRKSALGR